MITSRPTEEQRKIQSMGGRASVAARREKKLMREYAELLLSLPVKDKRRKSQLEALGVNSEDADNKMLVMAALMKKAHNGDVSAIKEIRSVIGEDNITLASSEGSDNLFAAVMQAVMGKDDGDV